VIRCKEVTSTSAVEEPVGLSEMKVWLRVDEDETIDDGLIQALIGSARERVEERHNRAFLTRSFDAYLDDTPCGDEVRLPRAPLVSVTSIKGFSSTDLTDTGGTAMSTDGFYADVASEPGRVVLTGSAAWPTATRAANALIIRFTAGESTSPYGVQERAKTEIKQLVARLYEHRGDDLETAKILTEYESSPSDLSLPEWG
jgi:uncharacterized phiE125 gp8 family phage protein